MRKVLPFILLLLMLSCASRRGRNAGALLKASDFYSEIISATNNYNDTANARIVLRQKSFSPTKSIFEKLSGELANSKYLIYLFTWENTLPTIADRFRAIVVDKTTGKAFYASKSDAGNDIILRAALPEDFQDEDFVLKSYSQKRVDLLKSLQNRFSSAEVGQDYMIYEVDKINQTNKVTVLRAVTVDENELTRQKGS